MRRLLTCLLCLCAAAAAHAQSARWEAADSGDPSELQLIIEDATPEGDPQLPRVEGLTLSLVGTSSQTTINNFNMSRATILTYRARSQKSGPLQIPAFTLQTNKGSLRVPAFTGGALRSAADANVVSRLTPGSTTVWAGEVFPLTYVLDVARRSFNQLGTNIEWNAAPLVVEDWSKFEPRELTSGGEQRLHINATTRAYAKSPGPLTLNAANQLVNLQSGSIGFGLFQTPRIEQLSVTSNAPVMTVRPLPPAPAGFSGAVGTFKLVSKVVPTTAAPGEPITWTLELSGTGNWPDLAGLPQRNVSKDFNVVQPQAKRTPAEGKLFDATLSEDVVLVPTVAGDYALGPVNFVYFDPSTGTYQTISTPRTVVTISAPAAPATSTATAPASSPGAERSSTELTEAKKAPETPAAPVTPLGLPRDPLAGDVRTMTPLPDRTLATLVAAPFAVLPLLWAWLAIQRAQLTDPVRPRREARDRLRTTLAGLRQAPAGSPPSALLLQWQHDATIVWALAHAAPAASALPDAAWSTLWSEADRALYGDRATLPADWVTRAEAALAAKKIPAFTPLRLFLPRNLFPFVALVALTFNLPGWLDAQPVDPAEAAYREGNFTRAEKIWADALAKQPTNAIVRHNLSLALAQQDRWAEAAAQASAAFVQHPSLEATRWQLALAAEKAGYIPAPLARFLPAGPAQAIARHAAPATWQVTLVVAAALFAAAFATLLYGAYRPPSAVRTWSAFTVLTLAALTGIGATASLKAYGLTADAQAAIAWRAGVLRSIPTEADSTQKTTVLPAGSLGVVEKTLLGWVRLTFDNGQTGWVRKEEIVPLWR